MFKNQEIKSLVVNQTCKSKARAAEKRAKWLAGQIELAIQRQDFAVYKGAMLAAG